MSFRIKLFIALVFLGVVAAFFVGEKEIAELVSPNKAAPQQEVFVDQNHVYGDPLYSDILYGTVRKDRVGLRRQPGGNVFAYLTQGQRVTVLSDSRERAWVEVRAGAMAGWVSISDIAFDGE